MNSDRTAPVISESAPGRTPVAEVAKDASTADAHLGVFALAAESAPGASAPYRALVDEAGKSRGLVSYRDLAEYLL